MVVQAAKVGQVKDMEKVAGDMVAVLDIQEMLATMMGKNLMTFIARLENNSSFFICFIYFNE